MSTSILPARFVDVRGTTLHYRYQRARSGSSLTLLLVHGFGASGETWYDIAPLLGAHYNLVRVDLKGFGFSEKPDDSCYTLHEQAALLAEFCSRVLDGDVVLIGHSYGGAVVFLAHLKLREQVLAFRARGLVLIDSASYLQRLPFFIAHLRNPVTRQLMRALTTPEWRMRYVLRRIFVDQERIDSERVNRYSHFLRLPGAENALARAAIDLVPSNAEELSSLLKSVNLPTQILWGALDPVIPLERAYELRSDIPDSRLDVVANSGHVPHEENPDAAVAVILAFVRSLRR